MKHFSRMVISGLSISLLGLTVLAVNSQRVTDAGSLAPQTTDPWPHFVMVYRDEIYNWDSSHIQTYDVYRYTYQGVNNWRLELIESSRDPRVVGTWSSYDGVTYRSNSFVDGRALPEYVTKPDHQLMATEWLVPVSPEKLSLGGRFQQVARDVQKIQLHQNAEHPCSSLSAVWQARLCPPGQKNYQRVTDKFLTSDHAIPDEIVERVGGKITSRILVTSLTYQ